jgi:large subunit ribosomal protein L2
MLKNFATKENFRMLAKKRPEKSLLLNWRQRSGHGSSGRITSRHKGNGVKQLYRIVDFGQEKLNIKGKVLGLEYDPYRTSFIALVQYEDGDKRYIIAPGGLKAGDSVLCQDAADLKTGNRLKLKNISVGTAIYNIEIEPGRGGKMVRGAGTSCQILAQEGKFVQLKMPSGEIRQINGECFASVGAVSRADYIYKTIGKAGTSRHMGRRPHVRGTVMNPVDHPHGGGEGRQPRGMNPKTPWGKPAYGVRTRKSKWTDKYIIQRRKSARDKK